jgi:hypothetical protein
VQILARVGRLIVSLTRRAWGVGNTSFVLGMTLEPEVTLGGKNSCRELVSLDSAMEPRVRSRVAGTGCVRNEALLLGRKTHEGFAAASKARSPTR